MATEIEQIEDKIIEELKGHVPGIVTCDTWQGDIKELLLTPQKMPAAWVIYGGAKFGDRAAIGTNLVATDMRFTVVYIVKNLRTRKDGSRGAYELIEAGRERLKGFRLAPLAGHLWPTREDLVSADKGLFAYGQEYKRVTND